MKKLLLLALFCFAFKVGFSQQVAYSVHLNSGLFSFGGKNATNSSALILGTQTGETPYTYEPYGKNPGFSYGLALQAQRVNLHQLITGLQLGYEVLRSKVNISHAYSPLYSYPAPEVSGKSIMSHYFLKANPFIGKRIKLRHINLDCTTGLDLAYGLKTYEKSQVTDNQGKVLEAELNRDKLNWDTRLRVGLTAYYHRIGLTTGYAYGLRNYPQAADKTNPESYARLIRFGLTYQL